jgi:transposase
LKEGDSQALQESLRNLDRAFQNYFGKRAKYPKYKNKSAACRPVLSLRAVSCFYGSPQ